MFLKRIVAAVMLIFVISVESVPIAGGEPVPENGDDSRQKTKKPNKNDKQKKKYTKI